MEHLYEQGVHTPLERIGWPDKFIEHGKVPELRERHGISVGHCVEKVLRHLPKKSAGSSDAEKPAVEEPVGS
jgi:1-deoxy-D-xylulose-5-phosphate synthase